MLASQRFYTVRIVMSTICLWLTAGVAEASTVKKNFVACCELVQEIGGWLEYQSDFRWKENKCVTVMKDLGPCFSACKEIHHGNVVDNASPDEEAAQVRHQVVLVVSHFSSKHSHVHELEQAVCANLMNHHVAKVVMMFEGTDTGCKQMMLRFPSRKLVCRSLPYQPTYKDLFVAANHLPAGTLTMVAHTDVVFDHTLRLLWPEALRATPTVFVLSAGPPEGGGYRGQYVDMVGERCPSDRLPPNQCHRDAHNCPGCSWDVYIFASPLPPSLDYSTINVHMNILGAENLVGNALEASGIMLLNPCLHIHAQHWHCEAKMHKPATDRTAAYKSAKVMPCDSCPFLRPHKNKVAALDSSGGAHHTGGHHPRSGRGGGGMGGVGGHHGGHQFNYRRQLLLGTQAAVAGEEEEDEDKVHLAGNLTRYFTNTRSRDGGLEEVGLELEEEKDWDERMAAATLDDALVTALKSAANRSSTNLEWPEGHYEGSKQAPFQFQSEAQQLSWQRLLREKLTSEVARIQQRHSKGNSATTTTATSINGAKAVKRNGASDSSSSQATDAASQQHEAARAAYAAHEEALLKLARKPEELLAAGVITPAEAAVAQKPYRPPGEGIPYSHPGQAARRQRLEEAIEARDRRRAARVEARRNNRTSTSTSARSSTGRAASNRKSGPARNGMKEAGTAAAAGAGAIATATRSKALPKRKEATELSGLEE